MILIPRIATYVGTIAGTYRGTDYHEHGFVYYSDSTPSISFDCYSGGYTQAQGLNDPIFVSNSGTVVGSYVGTSWHGFTFDIASQHCTDFAIPPGGIDVYPMGINDAQWVVGYYDDSDDNTHGFLYRNGTFTTLDVPSGNTTMATGIDGLGRVIGQYCNDYDCG